MAMKHIFYVLVLLVCCSSCHKNDLGPEGTYTEVTPLAHKSSLTFSGDEMIWKITGTGEESILHYRLNGNKIELTAVQTPAYTLSLPFRLLDEHRIEIGNLYDLFPDNMVHYPATMTFER